MASSRFTPENEMSFSMKLDCPILEIYWSLNKIYRRDFFELDRLSKIELWSNNEEFNDIHDTHPVLKEKLKDKDKCFTKENYEVIEECEVCTEDEVTNHNPVVCAVEKSK